MIKKLIFFIAVGTALKTSAQYNRAMGFQRGQGLQQRGPVASQPPRLPEVNIEKAVGMTFYEIDKVLKRIGVKRTSKTHQEIQAEFRLFNENLNQIKRINTFLFSEGKSKIENARRETIKNKDYSIFQEINKEVTESLKPVIDVIKNEEEVLDKKLESLLNAKQLKKWRNYKEKLKK